MSNSKRIKALEKRLNITSRQRSGVRCTYWLGTMKDTGASVAVVIRNGEQIYRGIYSSMSDAKANGVLAWMLDETTVDRLNGSYGCDPVEYIIMIEKESGDMWVSRAKDWLDPDLLYVPDPSAKNPIAHHRIALKVLPTHFMKHLPAEVSLLNGESRAIKSVNGD